MGSGALPGFDNPFAGVKLFGSGPLSSRPHGEAMGRFDMAISPDPISDLKFEINLGVADSRKRHQQIGENTMSDNEKKDNGGNKSEKSCCYRVVDGCGCVVGTACCDGPDMSGCRISSCC